MAKVDRELYLKFIKYSEQMSAIFTSARSASGRGSDPYVTYYYSLVRSLELAYLTSKDLVKYKSDVMYHIVYTPSNMGGLGIPSMTKWLCGESADKLTTYIAECNAIIKMSEGKPLAESMKNLMYKVLSQPTDDEAMMTTSSSPYTIKYKGISDGSNAITQVLANHMLNYCDSPSFRTALELYLDKGAAHSLDKSIKSCEWDAAVLEEVLTCSPTEAIKALISRAVSNELLNFLMTSKEKRRITRDLRSKDKQSLTHVARLVQIDDTIAGIAENSSSYETSFYLKDEFNKRRGLRIINHTFVDTLMSLAHQDNSSDSTIVVTFNKLKSLPAGDLSSIWGETKTSIYNMYDCTNVGTKFLGTRCRGILDKTNMSYRAMDVVQRSVMHGATLAAYVDDKGGNGGHLWDLVCAMWGITDTSTYPCVSFAINASVSTKRISSKLSSRSHVLSLFPNCQGSVVVDSSNLANFMDREKIHEDLMSYVSSIRCSALLDMAGLNCVQQPRRYNMSVGCIPFSLPGTFSVMDEKLFEFNIRELASKCTDTVREWFTFATMEYSATEGDGEDWEAQMDSAITAQSVVFYDRSYGVVQPGTMADILGITDARAFRSISVAKRKVDYSDVARFEPRLSVIKTYKDLTRDTSVDKVSSMFSSLAYEVSRMCDNVIPDEAYTVSWDEKELIGLADKIATDPVSVMKHVSKFPGMMNKHISHSEVQSMLGQMKYEYSNVLVSPSECSEKHFKYMLSNLYLAAKGRFREQKMYHTVALVDDYMIEKSWKFAAKRAGLLEIQSRDRGDSGIQTYMHTRKALYYGAANSARCSSTIREFVRNLCMMLGESMAKLTERKTTISEYTFAQVDTPEILHPIIAEGICKRWCDELMGDYDVSTCASKLPGDITGVLNDYALMKISYVPPEEEKGTLQNELSDLTALSQLIPNTYHAEIGAELISVAEVQSGEVIKNCIVSLYMKGEMALMANVIRTNIVPPGYIPSAENDDPEIYEEAMMAFKDEEDAGDVYA